MKPLVYIFVILLLISCWHSNRALQGKFDAIIELTKKQGANDIYEFSLDSLTDFEWDEAYIFPGNTGGIGLDYISKNIGTEWDGSDVEDNYIRLMFLEKKEVVAYIDFDRSAIWLSGCEASPHVNPAEAVARIVRGKDNQFITYYDCSGGHKILTFYPKRCLFTKTDSMNCE